jgi:hypothetical protein
MLAMLAIGSEHQEKSKRTLRHLVTSVDLIKLNKVDSEGDLLNLSRNVLKIAYLRPQGALCSGAMRQSPTPPPSGPLNLVAVILFFFGDRLHKFTKKCAHRR